MIDRPAHLPAEVTIRSIGPGVWFVTGTVGTRGPYGSIHQALDAAGTAYMGQYIESLRGPALTTPSPEEADRG